jgi:hypothetical protein
VQLPPLAHPLSKRSWPMIFANKRV